MAFTLLGTTYSPDLTDKVYLFLAVHVLTGAIVWLWRTSNALPKLDLPVVGDPNAVDFRSAMMEGAAKVRVKAVTINLASS